MAKNKTETTGNNKLESVEDVVNHATNNPDATTVTTPSAEPEVLAPINTPIAMIDETKAKAIVIGTGNIINRVRMVAEVANTDLRRFLLAMVDVLESRVIDEPTKLVSAQKEFSRGFMRVAAHDAPSVRVAMKYINWAYTELTNPEALKKAGVELINKLSPLDPMNSMKYTVTQKNVDIDTFIGLIIILDVKSNPATRKRKIDLKKIKSKAITDTIYDKMNAYYIED